IGRQLERVRRSQANRTQALAALDDPDAQAPLIVALKSDAAQLRELARQRDALTARRRDWEAVAARLEDLETWCGTVAARLAGAGPDERRLVYDALGLRVVVRTDRSCTVAGDLPFDDVPSESIASSRARASPRS